jgi:hypothetical protein
MALVLSMMETFSSCMLHVRSSVPDTTLMTSLLAITVRSLAGSATEPETAFCSFAFLALATFNRRASRPARRLPFWLSVAAGNCAVPAHDPRREEESDDDGYDEDEERTGGRVDGEAAEVVLVGVVGGVGVVLVGGVVAVQADGEARALVLGPLPCVGADIPLDGQVGLGAGLRDAEVHVARHAVSIQIGSGRGRDALSCGLELQLGGESPPLPPVEAFPEGESGENVVSHRVYAVG